MDHVGSKIMSLCQILEKLCVHCTGRIFSPIIMKLGQNVCLDETRTNSKLGFVESKTRSLGPISEKPCVCFRGHIFSPIPMKLRVIA